jgi:hypothetical protein
MMWWGSWTVSLRRAAVLVTVLGILGYLAYLVYAGLLKEMCLPKDYAAATHLFRHQVDGCGRLADSVDVVHKYSGKYVFVLRSLIEGLRQQHLRYSHVGDVKRVDEITNRIPELLARHGVTLTYRLSAGGATLAENTVTRFHYSASDSFGAQEFYCFAYSVPEEVPAGVSVNLTYRFGNCTQAVLDSMGQAEIYLEVLSGK